MYTNKYDANTKLTAGSKSETIETHLNNLATSKYDASTQFNINNSSKTIEGHLNELSSNKYDASTQLTVGTSGNTIEAHLNNLATNKYDASTKLTVGANNDEQTIKTHLDNLARNKYDASTEITIGTDTKRTIEGHFNNYYNYKTTTDQNFDAINGVIGKWNDTTVGTTLGLDEDNNNITKALEAIVSTTTNINSSMSLFNGSVATQNKVLLGNTYPSYNRSLVGLVGGADYEINLDTQVNIIPAEDMSGETIVNSLYLEIFNNDVVTKLETVITDPSKVDSTIRIRLGPNIKLGDFLNKADSYNFKTSLFIKLFSMGLKETSKNIIIQCYASSLGEITVDDIKSYMKLNCQTAPYGTYNITFIFYDYPPEPTTVSELVTALDQETDTTEQLGENESLPINYNAKLVYLF